MITEQDYGISPAQYHSALDKLWKAVGDEKPTGPEDDVFTLCVNKIDRLQAIVDKLLKTADGVRVCLNMEAWYPCNTTGLFASGTVNAIHANGVIGLRVGFGTWRRVAAGCYSTLEAVKAAGEEVDRG